MFGFISRFISRNITKPEGPFPRNMTKDEWKQLHHGCLFCYGHNVYSGAQGGLSTNFECYDCGAKYNLAAVACEFGCEIVRGSNK